MDIQRAIEVTSRFGHLQAEEAEIEHGIRGGRSGEAAEFGGLESDQANGGEGEKPA